MIFISQSGASKPLDKYSFYYVTFRLFQQKLYTTVTARMESGKIEKFFPAVVDADTAAAAVVAAILVHYLYVNVHVCFV